MWLEVDLLIVYGLSEPNRRFFYFFQPILNLILASWTNIYVFNINLSEIIFNSCSMKLTHYWLIKFFVNLSRFNQWKCFPFNIYGTTLLIFTYIIHLYLFFILVSHFLCQFHRNEWTIFFLHIILQEIKILHRNCEWLFIFGWHIVLTSGVDELILKTWLSFSFVVNWIRILTQ